MKFDDQTVVVTGGASGIGRATVMRFAEAGAKVVVGDLNAEAGAAVAAEVGEAAEFVKLDVTDEASVEAFAAEVLKRVGTVDVLVNNVGGAANEPFIQSKPEAWQLDTEINFLGPVRVTHAFLGAMIEAGRGKIVNVASDAGRVGSTGESVYAGAKGGVIAFTKSLAREVARQQINVNCVCPGPTDTPLLRERPEKFREALQRAIPFRRFAQPEDIADAILFFASSRSSYMTGQVVSVSGGLTMAG
jgi:2-hydroxycyclohexanecarboxyl-CoA dehydrogenase